MTLCTEALYNDIFIMQKKKKTKNFFPFMIDSSITSLEIMTF